MVIVKLMGGLGNQLFQYAAARRFALANNMRLKLDHLTGYENDSYGRKYSLKHFNIKENLISNTEINQIYKKGRICRKVIKVVECKVKLRCLLNFIKNNLCCGCFFLYESGLNFNQNIFDMKSKKDIYLNGYWGSEKYFNDIKDIIRKEFRVKYALDEQNQEMITKISDCESVSLHIRRGDFVRRMSSINLHGVCSMDYYHNAIEKLMEEIDNPHLYIFSDDPQWTQKNMNLSFPTTYVTINGADKDYEDLRLMSLCKHNIIANSTFSWWGAWLNPNPDKIVIAPKIWFRDPVENEKINFEDLYPKQWIMI